MLNNLIKSIVILSLLDYIYLSNLSDFFNKQINDVQKSPISFRWESAILCYIVLIFSLNYFILNTNKTRKQKIIDAILLGLVIYAVYELTTYTIIKDWRISTVIIDTLWGGILFGLTTFIVTL
jgi:uncharacterized membrane protein